MLRRKRSLRFILPVLALCLLAAGSIPQQQISAISTRIEIRKLHKGRLLQYEADSYYKINGRLITKYLPPNNYYLLTDKEGNLSLYNPETNEVRMSTLPEMSSAGSFFYYFLTGTSDEMGVRDFGFELDKQEEKAGMKISDWLSKNGEPVAGNISRIRLVHQEDRLIFLAYYDLKGEISKKNYYSQYLTVKGLDLPTVITEITYLAPGDSLIEKSVYRDIKVNDEVNQELANFEIPEDAVIK